MIHYKNRCLALASLALTLTLLAASPAQADSARDKAFGAGFVLGVPSGVSVQWNRTETESLNGGAAWSIDHWFQLWADYTWHFPRFVSGLVSEYSPIDAYLGFGAGLLVFNKGRGAGMLLRIPLGLEYKLSSAPLGFFLEVVPAMVVAPKTDGELQGGIGGRFYF